MQLVFKTTLTNLIYIDSKKIHLSVKFEAYRTKTVVAVDTRMKPNKPVGFELNSNIHMYYALGSHIYSLSSMTTYVFLAWQTSFVC